MRREMSVDSLFVVIVIRDWSTLLFVSFRILPATNLKKKPKNFGTKVNKMLLKASQNRTIGNRLPSSYY